MRWLFRFFWSGLFFIAFLCRLFFFFFMLNALRQSGQKNLIPYFFRVKLEINLTISFPTVVVYNFSEIEANFTQPNFSVIALWHVFLSLNEQCNVCIFLLLRILAKTCRVYFTNSSKNVFGNFAKDRDFSIFQISLPKHVHMGCKFQGTWTLSISFILKHIFVYWSTFKFQLLHFIQKITIF